jgi:multidrug efflux pump subunit AcrA (membrane-fusion protein)
MKARDRQFRDTEIRAPFDGYFEKRFGPARASWSRPRCRSSPVVESIPLKVIAEIPRRWRPWIKDGQPVELHVDAYPQRTFEGKGVAHQPRPVNTATRAFPFEALVPNRDAVLKPGRLHAFTSRAAGDQVLTLPYSALQYSIRRQPRCSSVDSDKLNVRELKVGDRLGERIEILAGVKAGRPRRGHRVGETGRRGEGERPVRGLGQGLVEN